MIPKFEVFSGLELTFGTDGAIFLRFFKTTDNLLIRTSIQNTCGLKSTIIISRGERGEIGLKRGVDYMKFKKEKI